jgi:hypothetical protein
MNAFFCLSGVWIWISSLKVGHRLWWRDQDIIHDFGGKVLIPLDLSHICQISWLDCFAIFVSFYTSNVQFAPSHKIYMYSLWLCCCFCNNVLMRWHATVREDFALENRSTHPSLFFPKQYFSGYVALLSCILRICFFFVSMNHLNYLEAFMSIWHYN